MVALSWQRVAQTRVYIRAPALAVVRRTGWQRPWVSASSVSWRRPKVHPLFPRKNTPASLPRASFRAEFRVGRYAARRAARKPSRLTVAVAAVASAGAIAAVGGTASWALA